MLNGLNRLEPLFRPEPIARTVPVRLEALGISKGPGICGMESVLHAAVQGLEPISLHVLLALLGQHQGFGSGLPGICIPDPVYAHGHSCLVRLQERGSGSHLCLTAMHALNGSRRAWLDPEERRAVDVAYVPPAPPVFDDDPWRMPSSFAFLTSAPVGSFLFRSRTLRKTKGRPLRDRPFVFQALASTWT